tara:strand:- start:2761 stop:7311 length:4551 start_codon:yes stop_codon:yes gene_type:complete
MTLSIRKPTSDALTRPHRTRSRCGKLIGPLFVCLLGMIVAGGWFVRSVLSLPTRTPILTLTGVYGPEWDLNGWVAEDLHSIKSLSRGTYSIHPLPSVDHLAGGSWDEADQAIRTAIESCADGVPLLVYVNLHGAVNDDGVACLIPKGASVSDASTWFPIHRLLKRIEQVKPDEARHPIVLLLECGKLRSHWPAGIRNNDFVDRLEDLVAEHHQNHPESQITVIAAAAKGQRSFASVKGHGNRFTRAIAEGLAGQADGKGRQPIANGIVDTDELFRFVSQRVAGTVTENQEPSQTPIIVHGGRDVPIPLARTMRRDPLKSIPRTPPASTAETERLHTALEAVAEIGKRNPIAVNPQAWAQVQRTSHALAQSVSGGLAVRATSERWYSRLARQVQSLRQQIEDHSSESSMLADLQADRNARVIWRAVEKQPSRETATAAIRDVDSQKAMPVPMLHALLDRPELSLWHSRDRIQRVAKAQIQWLETTSRLPDGMFPAIDSICDDVHNARRHLADVMLADKDDETIETALVRFETAVSGRCDQLITLRGAWQLRDRVFVELPFLVQWLDESSRSIDSDHTSVDGSIADVISLDTLLTKFFETSPESKSKPDSRPTADEIAVASKRAAAFLGKLTRQREAAFHQHHSPHQGASADGTPTESTETCTELCRLIAAEVSTPATSDDASHATKYDAACASYLSVLLGKSSGDVTAKRLRAALRSMSEMNEAAADLDGRWRRVVSLVVDDDFAEVIDRSQKASRQQRLASRANEVLDDFWYAPANQDVPYFAVTADALIGLAESTADENPLWRERKRSLTTKLAARRSAATEGLVIKATSQPSYASDGAQLVSIQLDHGNVQADVPSGTANLVLRQKNDSNYSAERPIEISDDASKPVHVEVPLQANRNQQSFAELHFRGNTYQSDVMVSDSAFGVSVDGQPATNRATITISDAMDSRRAICFVLDCSASMNDPVEIEVAREESATLAANKFDAARSALFEMLRRLEPEDSEVGLVLYGHRMAVGGKEPKNLLQKRYFKQFPFPQTVQPYEDVAVVLPTGRFDTVQLQIARQHFDAAAPWGQTPLYLAIDKAIDDIARSGDGASKNVVVISDGRNYQFNPTPDAMVSMDAVIQKATQNNVRVHVIGFGLPQKDLQAAAAEFSLLAKNTGGESVADVRESTDLLRRLEQFTAADQFSLKLANGTSVQGEFGKTVSLDHIASVNTPVTATVNDVDATIYVSPGDQLRLIANRMRHSLSTPAYLQGSPRFVDFAAPGGNVIPAKLGVQVPVLRGQDCRFLASIQDSHQQIAQRPTEVWFEVRATEIGDTDPIVSKQSRDRTGHVYRTSQVQWLPGMSCPVAEFKCMDWPVDATGYEMHAWIASAPAERRTISLTDQDRPSNASSDFQPVPGCNGIRYRVARTGREVQVAFEYDHPGDPDSMLMVELGGVELDSTQHWYDETRMRSFHRFTLVAATTLGLDAPSSGTTPEDIILHVNTIAEMKSHAFRTVTPVRGDMYPAIATLPATRY